MVCAFFEDDHVKQGGELRREERRLPREVVLQLRLRRFFEGFLP